ncbi:MAG: Trp family transcriptional regulator [Actinobacteria bacterium]|nr:Trp family transcriptional regulator [Actinomycetota bacterium]
MPRVSKFKLGQKELERINKNLSYLISSLNKSEAIESFLDEFLTKEEKTMLAKRLVLFIFLKRNYPPSVIRSALNLSYETIRIYQNQLNLKSKSFHELVEKLIRREQTKELFEKIDKLLKPLSLVLESKSNMKSRAKFLSGDY